MPLGYFELKEINTINILPDKFYANKNNIIKITVNSFFKKNIKKGERTFYFSAENRSQIYEWLITLNFLRVKSIYDEFKIQFGVINLPMNHEIKVSHKKKIKLKLNFTENEKKLKKSNSYSNFMRKSMIGSNNISSNINSQKLNLKKRNSNIMNVLDDNFREEIDENKPIRNIREDIQFIWVTGILTLMANVQKRIFEEDLSIDSKLLITPEHISDKIKKHCELNEKKKLEME